jgi:hypothetical protein
MMLFRCAALAVVLLSSCHERPIYRVGENVGGINESLHRDGGAPSGSPGSRFTLPEPTPPPSGAQLADARACGLEKFTLERDPPSLMLVLDRSSSMSRRPMGGPAGATLWTETLAALDEVVKVTEIGINWGLKLFPQPSGCLVADGAEVPIARSNHAMVLGRARSDGFNMSGTSGTPTNQAVDKAVAYLRTVPAGPGRYIVLATDGEPNCADTGGAGTARTLSVQAVQDAVSAGFKTYVIGIAIVPEAVDTLNRLAVAGGVPRSDPMFRFYPVTNRMDLIQALGDIAGQIQSCVFTLSKPPPVPDSVKVTVDGDRAPESPTDGWSYANNQNTTIQLNGAWCERVKMRQQAQVDIVFGCPGIVVP